MNKPPDISFDAAATLAANIAAGRELLDSLRELAPMLQQATTIVRDALLAGHKLLACGNGGSAGDGAHFTAEIAGRYVIDRPGFPAIDLTAEHSVLTALSNDYPPAQAFARLVRALGAPGDVLVVFTTSGNSANIVQALDAARAGKISTIAFLGRDGGKCRGKADVELVVRSNITARIQESHLLLYHSLCELLDPILAAARR